MDKIVLGDIHGLRIWKKIVDKHSDCSFVFLGDYLDPYEEPDLKALLDNLKEIIEFKKADPKKVVLLLGNHDLHYMTYKIETSSRYLFEAEEEIKSLFLSNEKLFQYAYQEENVIFTHAGISDIWFMKDFKGDINSNIADQLNKPASDAQEQALFACSIWRGGGEKRSGIFWADINELAFPLKNRMQIVGHNRVKKIVEVKENAGRIFFCDSLFNGNYLKVCFREDVKFLLGRVK